MELVPITLQGKNESGKEFRDIATLGVTKDQKKILYIRIWGVDDKDPNKVAIEEDVNIILRNLQYRAVSSDVGTDSGQ